MANNTCFTRVCIDCGRVMHNVGYGRKRCPASFRRYIIIQEVHHYGV